MTWRTSEGNRVLGGSEAELVREVLAIMVDRVSDNVRYRDDVRYGDNVPLHDFYVEMFDALTPSEQVSVIDAITRHLLFNTTDTLPLTSVNESAVYAVFRTLAVEIEMEIDNENDPHYDAGEEGEFDELEWKTYWRSRTLDAYQECFVDELNEELDDDEFDGNDWESSGRLPQDALSVEMEQWELMTESLADRILWDRDFEMAASFLDRPPEQSAAMKHITGIETDYFSDVPMDVRPLNIEQTLSDLRKITHRKPR